MTRYRMVVAAMAVAVAGAAAAASVGEGAPPAAPGMHGAPRMMQGGISGMGCPMMGGGMGGGMMGSGMMGGGMMGRPMLPPGNEKLQLQMQAEIMQKVGEIMAKYAAQIQQR